MMRCSTISGRHWLAAVNSSPLKSRSNLPTEFTDLLLGKTLRQNQRQLHKIVALHQNRATSINVQVIANEARIPASGSWLILTLVGDHYRPAQRTHCRWQQAGKRRRCRFWWGRCSIRLSSDRRSPSWGRRAHSHFSGTRRELHRAPRAVVDRDRNESLRQRFRLESSSQPPRRSRRRKRPFRRPLPG